MDADYDLFADTAAGDVRDPYPDYAAARRTAPVAEEEQFGQTWVQVFRYADVGAVLADPQTFSSSLYEEAMGPVMGTTILQMDGHEHHVNRALVASAFRRKALESWETTLIGPAVHSLIDSFEKDGEADLVRQLTFLFPIRVIQGILGIPAGDERQFARWSIELISWAVDFERGKAAARSIRGYVSGILHQRRARPADDLISSLAHAEIDGKRLSDDAIFGFLNLLMPAGAETTYR
ncbi:MAG: cytochrome P450, partial [Actinomycetota bacterium]